MPYAQIGSLVLAFIQEEVAYIERLYQNGIVNGVSGLQVLSGEEVAVLEPGLPPVQAALWVPTAAIVSPWEYTMAMAENAVENGV